VRRASLLALLCLCAAPAHADPPVFDLELEGCEGLDEAALSRRLELELLDVAPSLREVGPPPVVVRCTDALVAITIGDPATGKTVAREVPRPDGVGAERVIALSVAELYIASWLELLMRPAPEAGEPDPPQSASSAAPEAEEGLREAARTRAASAIAAPTGVRGAIGIEGGAGLRDLGEPFATVVGGLRASVHPGGDWGVALATRVERGEAHRQRGSVVAWWGSVELGVAWRALRRGAFRLGADLRAGVLYTRIEGRAAEGVRADAHGALGARVALALRPALVAGRFRGGLTLTLGVDLNAPTGLVSGEAPVRTGGFFLSLGVDLAAILGDDR